MSGARKAQHTTTEYIHTHTYRRVSSLFLFFRSIKPRYTANRGRSKLVIVGVDHICAAEPFVAWLFPLGNERRVHQLLVNAELVDLLTDLFVNIIQIVYVATFLPVDLVYGPD